MDKFLIGYTDNNSGFQSNVKPWLLPDNAFSSLENLYVFRGRVRKRFGSVWMGTTQLSSRLKVYSGTTNGSGAISGTADGAVFAIGQMFSCGSDIFTVNATGTPATLLSTNPAATMTYNTTTGAFSLTGSQITTELFFYPATPVMGIYEYFVPATPEYATIAFDTQFSYLFNNTTYEWFEISGGTDTWTGTDANFFWGINYQGSNPNVNEFWVTNNNPNDGIRYYDFGTATWTTPTLTINNSGDTVLTCLLMVQFQNRLLLFNTIEDVSSTPTHYFNRVRYSAYGSPLAANAWNQDVPGQGNFIDAPVQEEIVTAQFIKNRLIVYFTDSTYELVYTGNQAQPFVWQKINTELGAESTFSEVPFDRQVFGIDGLGVHACNGANVDRIDEVIPQLSFGISNIDGGNERVVGIRDYYNELVYWSYPNQNRNSSFYFPNKILVYNYINESWATFDDSITFFGSFLYQPLTPGATWGSTTAPWQNITMLWNSGVDTESNTKVRTVLAGNQEGFVVVLRPQITSNAAALQVTAVTAQASGTITITCINHNLVFGDYVLLSDMNGLTFTGTNPETLATINLPTVIGMVSSDPFNTASKDSFTLSLLDTLNKAVGITGTYTGGGLIARVSQINATTKQYNFYTAQDRDVYVSRIDFLVDKTAIGQVSVDYLVSSSQSGLLSGSIANGSMLGNNTLETSAYPIELAPFEQFQDRLWHPVYFGSEGECVQYSIFMTPTQMYNYVIDPNGMIDYNALQDFQMHAMVIYANPTTSRMQ